MTTDKTGAPTTVTAATDQFTIAVDGQQVGLVDFVDHDGQRIFHHTEVDDAFEGRGLASILVSEALASTRGCRAAHRRRMSDGRRLPRQTSRLRRRRRSGHHRHQAFPAAGAPRVAATDAAIV